MAANGGPPQRISFGEGASYSTPVWSPRGDAIAFTRQSQGNFAIGIMRPDGRGERVLTEGYHNEGPTFAPNATREGELGMSRRALLPAATGAPQKPVAVAGGHGFVLGISSRRDPY